MFTIRLIIIALFSLCFSPHLRAFSTQAGAAGDSLSIRRNYCLRVISDTTNVYDNSSLRLRAYDSLAQWSLDEKDTLQYYKYRFGKGKIYKSLGNTASAYHLYKAILYNLSQKPLMTEVEQSYMRTCFLEIPSLLTSMGRANEGLIFAHNLLRNFPDWNDYQRLLIYTDIACASIGADQQQTKVYIDKAEKLLHAIGEDDPEYAYCKAKVCNAYAGYLFINHRVDSTIYYLNKVEESFKNSSVKTNRPSVYMNYANVCSVMGDFEMALVYLNQILESLPPEYGSYMRGEALLDIATLKRRLSAPLPEVIRYLKESVDYSQQVGDQNTQYRARLLLSELYHQQGDERKEKDMRLVAYRVRDSLTTQLLEERAFWATKDLEIHQLQAERMKTDNMLISRKLYVRNWILVFVAGVCLLLLAGGILFYFIRKYRFQHRRMMEELVQQQNATQQNMNSIEGQFLTAMSQNLQKSNVLKVIKDYLKQIRMAPTAEQKNEVCGELEKQLRSYEIDRGKNEDIYLQFEMRHPKFAPRLREYCDKLTENDIHICMLLVSDMTVKEIAALNNYAPRSVETIIYRARRKLNLTADDKTVDFLKTFLD